MNPSEESQTRETYGKVRLEKAERQQVRMLVSSLDELIPSDHRVRMVWGMIEKMDMGKFYKKIAAYEGGAGRPAIDPRLLVGVWLYATLEGVGSARELARLCKEHIAYRWLMGDIKVNYHTLADFRVENEQELDGLLVQGVAVLMNEGVVKMEQTAQDGLRVRASAGAGSFRKKTKLEGYLEEAQQRVEELKQEVKGHQGGMTRQQAAQKRAVEERQMRLKKALEEVQKIEKKRERSHHKKKSPAHEERCSQTDPEARYMQMPAGEVRPAFNAELSIDVESGIIVGVDVVNEPDKGQMAPMLEQIHKSYGQYPKEHLVDGGFATWKDIEDAHDNEVTVYSPLPKPNRKGQDPSKPRKTDGPGVKAWRERMTTEEAKEKYKRRAAAIEWANALARMRGFQQMVVRGIRKVRSVLLWFALAHNLMQTVSLTNRQLQPVG